MKDGIIIDVPMPAVGQIGPVGDWDSAVMEINKRLPTVIEMAENAFAGGSKEDWGAVQQLLYHWNIEELERLAPPTDYRRTVNYVLRNALIAVENKYRKTVSLACYEQFTIDDAVTELREAALSHRINSHPLLEHMNKYGVPIDVANKFLENYYVNNRVFHLHLAVLTTTSPMNHRADIAKNFYDEMGAENGVDYAHPNLFLRNFDSIGATRHISPLVEALYMLNCKIRHTLLSDDYRFGVGGLGFIELTMPQQMTKILSGLENAGFPKNDLIFWELHIQIDAIHGETWFNEMREIVKTPDDAYKVLNGGLSLLDARAEFYDGVWNYMKVNEEAA